MRPNSEQLHDRIDLDRLEFLQRKCERLAADIMKLQQELRTLTDPEHRCILSERPSEEDAPLDGLAHTR
jgi:hypothetical protein